MKILCEYGCGQEAKYQFKNRKWCCSKSWNSCSFVKEKRRLTVDRPEVSQKIGEALKVAQNKLEVKEKKSKFMKEFWRDLQKRKEWSKKMKEVWNDVELKEQASRLTRELWNTLIYRENVVKSINTPEVRKKNSDAQKIAQNRLQVKEKKRKASKDAWERKSSKEKELIISKIFRSRGVKPNKTELFVDNLIQVAVQNQFKYVGDGQTWIAGKCPDWINVNGKKQVIEYFSNYWHKVEHETERKEHFKNYGYDCLVIWESELKNLEELKQKILKF